MGTVSMMTGKVDSHQHAPGALTGADLQPPRTPQLPPEIVPLRARQTRPISTFRALRHRNFRLYLFGNLISMAGTWMQIIAQGWLVYQLSRSEAALGIVGFAAAIPALLITPWAGVVVDRTHKRNLLVITQTGAMFLALILAALTFTGVVQVWHVVLLAIGIGVVNAFDGPARQAFVVEMVGHEDMSNAIALNSMTFNTARVVGPAFGGILLATVGAAWCFLFNSLSFLAVIASLLLMRIAYEPAYKEGQSPLEQFKSGLRYATGHRTLRGLLMLALVFSTFGISYSTVLPAFVDRVLHQSAQVFGLLTSAAGVGAVTGAFLVAKYGDRGKRGLWLFSAAMSFPVVLTVFALNDNLILSLGLALLLGIGFMLQFTLINTLLQTHVADNMRGRVLSLYTLTFFGFTPFGNLAVGALAEATSLSLALTFTASITLVASAAVFWKTPELRRLA